MTDPPAYQVTVAAGSAEEAERLSAVAVDGRLAACAQVIGPVTSRYRWEGRTETVTEWLCLLKTSARALDALVGALEREHSYDVPEVVATPLAAGSRAYLDWVAREACGPEAPAGG